MIDSPEFEQFNWMVDMVQNIDMGLIVVDRDFTVHMWNGFMVHHTGKHPNKVQGKSLFDVFPEISEAWFRAKCRPVFELKCRSFVLWKQRPYLFRCRNVRPITGRAKFMYQNVTLNPMVNLRGEVQHMFISVADVTGEALAHD
ncbi:PAS domain-containing protein [Enterovibrio baiacu]|uniref:PAS domain-containing protein n=1 Tax=Enterovibrio baiacu TaxID=2491023 RepID=UPI00101092DC|nr:PAS domain-containing protein [Enterovibrio baiacu]MBE1276582.1 PAS domain-containing protein [Enterovibrio baiacu]